MSDYFCSLYVCLSAPHGNHMRNNERHNLMTKDTNDAKNRLGYSACKLATRQRTIHYFGC